MMLEILADTAGVVIILLLLLLLIHEKYTKPHSEYLRLLEEMPPYDHSNLELDALEAKIKETEETLKTLERLIKTDAKRDGRLHELRHKMTSIRLQLLKFEKLKRQLEAQQDRMRGDDRQDRQS